MPTSLNAVGIDDWAFTKGINYGTAIIDLDRHTVIDLLCDRESKTVENWFKNMPEVKVVSRDRFSPYAMGVTNGSPNAIQVADRWHLLKNMGDALQTLLERKRQGIIASQTADDENVDVPPMQIAVQSHPVNRQSTRHKRLEQIKKMYADGVALKAIARELRVSRNTVRKYIHLHEPPSRQGIKTTNLARFIEYLYTRMKEDKKVKVVKLFNEIKGMGYNGAKSTLQSFLYPYTKKRNLTRLLMLARASWSPSKVSVLLCKNEELLSEKEKKVVVDICNASTDIMEAKILASKFRHMMENRRGHLLGEWMEEVSRSCIGELKRFAKSLMSDYQAVENALTLPWSNGQVEGQINKLKTIKRQMYGRAGFELLRKRVILHSAYYHQN
ncbi:MAG: ISL3 family transposase [Williamsia sp.]|nr:ISL3 family transposase [Williamsia sp.]